MNLLNQSNDAYIISRIRFLEGYTENGLGYTVEPNSEAERLLSRLYIDFMDYPVFDKDDYDDRVYQQTIMNIKRTGSLTTEQAEQVYTWLQEMAPDSLENLGDRGGFPGKDLIKEACEECTFSNC